MLPVIFTTLVRDLMVHHGRCDEDLGTTCCRQWINDKRGYMSRYRGDFFRGSKKDFFPIHLFLNNSLLTYHGFLVKYFWKKLFMQQYIVPISYWVMGHFKNNNWTRFSQVLYIVAKIHFKNEIKWILFTKINSRKKKASSTWQNWTFLKKLKKQNNWDHILYLYYIS